jgi:hypothetical protein
MKKSFPFYYENYIAGTAFFNRREKGAYVDLLCYEADKGRMTLKDIKDILNGDFECWEKLKSKFTEENGLYYNKKLELVKQGRRKKAEEEIIRDREIIEKRIAKSKKELYDGCCLFLSKYPKDMVRRFYDYWTELNHSKTKIRYDLQRTFELGKRLATWAAKDKDFKSQQPKTHEEMLAMTKDNPELWKNFKAVLRPGERKAVYYPINSNL